jgi:hypothetical protein
MVTHGMLPQKLEPMTPYADESVGPWTGRIEVPETARMVARAFAL